MCDVLYLSPHLDDAILSCAARILEESTSGKSVLVATIFTEADTQHQSLYERRRAEDLRAITALGAAGLHLGLLDAPFRRPYYSSFRTIILGSHPEGADEEQLQRVLERLLEAAAPARVYCPLGVGTHIDHRLTYQAAVAVCGFERLTFYEDRPYALVPGQVAMRLAELSLHGDAASAEPAEFLTGFRAAHYVQTYLADSERNECEAILVRKLLATPGTGRRVRAEIAVSTRIEEILNAIGQYETQLVDLYGDRDTLRRESLRYAASLGCTSYAERFWGLEISGLS